MQEITRDMLVGRALELLADGTVNRVMGWKKGDFFYDVTPGVFSDAETLKAEFVYDGFCGANFSKYLIKETAGEGKVLVFLKPCDTYSFNQLLTEHRFDREKVYAIGIPCDGMLDINKVKALAGDGLVSAEINAGTLWNVSTSVQSANVRIPFSSTVFDSTSA